MIYVRPAKPTRSAKLSVPMWPIYGKRGQCEVCGHELRRKRQRVCDECKGSYWRRMYLGVHWSARLVVVRDGCKCAGCEDEFYKPIKDGGAALPLTRKLELDHVLPMVDGGEDSPVNWQMLCPPCHKKKTGREASERAVKRRAPLFVPSPHE